MRKPGNHIISKFTWDTSFDCKKKATELQSRLSSWSRIKMMNQMGAVFEKICPPDQCWKIDQLILDLGIIDFNELEQTLSFNLTKELHEKLEELLLYKSNFNQKGISINNEPATQISILMAFFLQGIMPWNYKQADGTVNDILARQMSNNRVETITMLKELAVTHMNVRKRIAWQLTEENMLLFIEGSEPANHKKIIGFSKQITTIQQKEAVVQCGTATFKKQLWFWILNYLFTEHGSVFNKKTFLKSSIRQMAAHNNTSYRQLLGLMQLAAEKIAGHNNEAYDFIQTLQLLAVEVEDSKTNASVLAVSKEENQWALLEKYFLLFRKGRLLASRSSVNALIESLAAEGPARFRQLLISLDRRNSDWVSMAAQLSVNSVMSILHSLHPAAAASIIEHSRFLHTVCCRAGLDLKAHHLFEAGIQYAIRYRDTTFSGDAYFNDTFAKINSTQPSAVAAVVENYIQKEAPVSVHHISSFEIYQSFKKAIQQYGEISLAPRIEECINKLLNELHEQQLHPADNAVLLYQLKEQFVRIAQLNPAAVFNALAGYDKINTVLPYLMDNNTAELLLKNNNSSNATLVIFLGRQMNELKLDTACGLLVSLVGEKIFSFGLETLLLKPHLNNSEMLECLLHKLFYIVPVSMTKVFGQMLHKIFANEKWKEQNVETIVQEKLLTTYFKQSAVFDKAIILQQAGTASGDRQVLARLLTLHFDQPEICLWQHPLNAEGNVLLNYFLNDGARLLKVLTNKYERLLGEILPAVTTAEISRQLLEIFWRCMLGYRYYNGSRDRFVQLFQIALSINFDLPVSINQLNNTHKNEIASQTPAAGNFTDADEKIACNNMLLQPESEHKPAHDILLDAARRGQLNDFFSALIRDYKMPVWLQGNVSQEMKGELLKLSATQYSEQFYAVLKNELFTAAQLNRLSNLLPYYNHGSVAWQYFFKQSFHSVPQLISQYSCLVSNELKVQNETTIQQDLQLLFWRCLLNYSSYQGNTEKLEFHFQQAIVHLYYLPVLQLKIRSAKIDLPRPNDIIGSYSTQKNNAASVTESEPHEKLKWIKQKLLQASKLDLMESLCDILFKEMELPVWLQTTAMPLTAADILNSISEHFPIVFLSQLQKLPLAEIQLQRLTNCIKFETLVIVAGRIHKSQQPALQSLVLLHSVLGKIKIDDISNTVLQQILHKKLLTACRTANWKIIHEKNILNEFIWDMMNSARLPKASLIQALDKKSSDFSPALRKALIQLKNTGKGINVSKKIIPVFKKTTGKKYMELLPEGETIAVQNAGLVILSGYVQLLFDRLGLTADNKFLDESSQLEAVHYLQYLVTGATATEEVFLPLNKLLCGVETGVPVSNGIEILANNRELIDGLISAVISYWPSIGTCSTDGFRGNWLVRNGLLTAWKDKWELTVEKRSYDMLISKSPFTFSVIKFPWMPKPLYVNWAY